MGETWQVRLAGGSAREVEVTRYSDRWGAQCGDAMTLLCGSPLRAVLAVVESLGAAGLDPRAVLAPEVAEELARVTAERDALRAIRARDIESVRQLRADCERLTAELDEARAERDEAHAIVDEVRAAASVHSARLNPLLASHDALCRAAGLPGAGASAEEMVAAERDACVAIATAQVKLCREREAAAEADGRDQDRESWGDMADVAGDIAVAIHARGGAT